MKNIGLIGCGNIAETYFRAQDYFNNINFVACADINLDAAKKTSQQFKKVRFLTDFRYSSNIKIQRQAKHKHMRMFCLPASF